MSTLEILNVALTLAFTFLAGAIVGAWWVQRPARRREREVQQACNLPPRQLTDREIELAKSMANQAWPYLHGGLANANKPEEKGER